MRTIRIGAVALLAAMAAACVPRTAPPAPTPPPQPAPLPPAPLPAPTPPPANWMDAPLSAGDWLYRQDGRSMIATFSQSGVDRFILRCDDGEAVALILAGSAAPGLFVNTNFGDRRLPAMPFHNESTVASLPATDPLLDQIAFSRGRFLVQAEGGTRLILPSWPEIARVIEDCRGQ